MKEILNQNNNVRRHQLESDNSDYFSKWGSRNPELTIREEIDNQISAEPTVAGIKIITQPGGKCTIQTFNDGNIPTPERMESMFRIGRTVSDGNGASICGVGQIEGLVAGRKSPCSTGVLTFKSVYNGMESIFICRANGKDYSIITENSGPFPTDDRNMVEKTYDGMRELNKDEIEFLKILVAVKIYPYAKKHPDFVYTFNGENIVPFSLSYDDIDDETIKRMPEKDYVITYHKKKYIVTTSAVDFARYVKPDGYHINEAHANKWDVFHNLSSEGSGVFVDLGDTYVITGGKDSWKFINEKYHPSQNGQDVFIHIPADKELKEAIFAESPNKSTVGIALNEIEDYDGTKVFEQMLEDISRSLNNWSDERTLIDSDGKAREKEECNKIANNVLQNNNMFITKMSEAIEQLSEDEKRILGTKKFKTIIDSLNNKEIKLCFKYAK